MQLVNNKIIFTMTYCFILFYSYNTTWPVGVFGFVRYLIHFLKLVYNIVIQKMIHFQNKMIQ